MYILYISLGIFSIVLICNGVIYLLHERLIFQGQNISRDYTYHFPFPFSEVYLPIDTGELHGVLLPCDDARGVILYFHGNNGDIRKWASIAGKMRQYSYDILLIDYRGYGKSRGVRSEQLIYADALRWFDYAQINLGYSDIVIYGRSLGSAIAIDLAIKISCQKLILETPITNIYIALEKFRWFLFPKYYFKYRFEAIDKINLVKCPIYILHGTRDFVVPFKSALSLFNKIETKTKKIVRIDKGGHNNLNNFELYQQSLKTMFQ